MTMPNYFFFLVTAIVWVIIIGVASQLILVGAGML
jgi:hypothetical protein